MSSGVTTPLSDYSRDNPQEAAWKLAIGVFHTVKLDEGGDIFDLYRFPLPEEMDGDFRIPVYCNGYLGLPLSACTFEGHCADFTPRRIPTPHPYIAQNVDRADEVVDRYFQFGDVAYQRGTFRQREPAIMRAVGTDGPGFTLAHLLTLIAQEQHRHHVDLIKRAENTRNVFDVRRLEETPQYESLYIVAVRWGVWVKGGVRWFPELEARVYRSPEVEDVEQ